MRNLINETEKDRIRDLYGLNYNLPKHNQESYLFDFVFVENNNYLIYMDNVISKKHGFVGYLWENTWIINEIIKENLEKNNSLLIEGWADNLDSILNSIEWTKEFFSECILNIEKLNESIEVDLEFFENIKNKASNVLSDVISEASKIGTSLKNLGTKLLGGIINTFRWIRRNAYTSIGIVVDVVTALIPVTTGINKTIWGLICLLSLYEIITGDIDPKDEERKANPYMFLIIDLISFIFAAAIGKGASVALKSTTKLPSATTKLLTSLLEKLPMLKGLIKGVSDFILKYLPKLHGMVSKVLSGMDRVILGLETFIKQLISKRGAVAVGTGVAISWMFRERKIKRGMSGDDVSSINKYFSEYHNLLWPDCQISPEIINSLKKDGNNFTENTENAVKKFEGCISKNPKYKDVIKGVDGEVTDYELSLYGDVEMDSRGIGKLIPHKAKEQFNKTVGGVISNLSKFAEKTLSPIAKS